MMGEVQKNENKPVEVIHVISHGKKWAVVKSKAKKATKLHEYREQAYHHARQLGDTVIVHNKNGSVLFKHG